MFAMVRRVCALVAVGAAVVIENPLYSFLWLFAQTCCLIGAPGWHLVRIDQCMARGTPCQNPQLWLAMCPAFVALGMCCRHNFTCSAPGRREL